MRLKNNPKAYEIIEKSPLCIKQAEKYKDSWKKSLSYNKSLFLEIGCGKGQFLTTLALKNPQSYYLGMEQYESVLYHAVKKAAISKSKNIGFLCYRAELLLDYFGCGEVDGIYLNFSDPWHKKRHAKRRLTSDKFLSIYNKILGKRGFIEFKTDNESLYDFSLESFSACPFFEIASKTTDLYNDPVLFTGNIPTEYEIKFQSRGNPIFKITVNKADSQRSLI